METETSQSEIKADLSDIHLSLNSKGSLEEGYFSEDDHSSRRQQVLHRRKHSEGRNAREDLTSGADEDVIAGRNQGNASLLPENKREDKESGKVARKDEKKEKEEDEEPVPDGGWGWVVVFGASLIVVLVDTMGQCFGILFSTFLLDLNTSAVVTAWIFNLYQFTYNMTGPILGPLINQFGWRPLTVVFSFIFAFGTITSAFVGSPYTLFFTYSLLVGVSTGMLSNISYLIVPHYFKKRRGLANGIIMAWDCGGQFIGAPLIKILQDEYSFTGATLILGGFILNCCIGAAVFHPVKWHVKAKRPKPNRKKDEELETQTQDQQVFQKMDNGEQSGKRQNSDGRRNVVIQLFSSVLSDLAILKSAKAVILALTTTVTFNGYLNFLAFVPFAMQESGFHLGDAATCVSLSAICNIVTRLAIAAFSDTKFFNFRITMMIGSLVISGSMLCFTLADSLILVKVSMAIWGCGVGSFNGIFNLVMIHYMGLEAFIPMFGASLLITGFGYLAVGPLAGYVRDVAGSYSSCIWVLTGVSFSSFLLWLLMPLAQAFDLRHDKNKKRREEENTNVPLTI
ncbi:monocarboxylate transporter 12-like [Macrobrachium nipponense]|uniref:monocarboxylate transporter 12-like n=1 Tax=Macrobrachium nipponense TaxID=159736 RepID=UPI0030C7F544